MSSEDDELLDLEIPAETSVWRWALRYKGSHYFADCVEVTPDTAYFQVDPKLVRNGIFPPGRLDARFFPDMEIVLCPVHHAHLMEQ